MGLISRLGAVGQCLHLDLIPVHSVDGTPVAHLCPGCDTQLPAKEH